MSGYEADLAVYEVHVTSCRMGVDAVNKYYRPI